MELLLKRKGQRREWNQVNLRRLTGGWRQWGDRVCVFSSTVLLHWLNPALSALVEAQAATGPIRWDKHPQYRQMHTQSQSERNSLCHYIYLITYCETTKPSTHLSINKSNQSNVTIYCFSLSFMMDSWSKTKRFLIYCKINYRMKLISNCLLKYSSSQLHSQMWHIQIIWSKSTFYM